VQRKLQRNHAKGETGVIRRTKAQLLSLLINPFPFGILLTPSVKRGLLNLSRFYAAGQNCFACLVGDVGRKRNRVLFCFEKEHERSRQIPNDSAKHSLDRIPIPHKPSPPFASQMPPPPRGEANPASPSCRHSDGFAVGARTHESEFRGCTGPFQTNPTNIPLERQPFPSHSILPALRRLCRRCPYPRE